MRSRRSLLSEAEAVAGLQPGRGGDAQRSKAMLAVDRRHALQGWQWKLAMPRWRVPLTYRGRSVCLSCLLPRRWPLISASS
jgi:hypothetical protein